MSKILIIDDVFLYQLSLGEIIRELDGKSEITHVSSLYVIGSHPRCFTLRAQTGTQGKRGYAFGFAGVEYQGNITGDEYHGKYCLHLPGKHLQEVEREKCERPCSESKGVKVLLFCVTFDRFASRVTDIFFVIQNGLARLKNIFKCRVF